MFDEHILDYLYNNALRLGACWLQGRWVGSQMALGYLKRYYKLLD